MKYRTKSTLLWILAFFLMAASAIYQRSTGPTYPKKGKVIINAQEVKYKLLRTWEGETDAAIKIEVPDNSITGVYKFKKYKSHDEWTEKPLTRDGNNLVGFLPNLPPAGKMMYEITLSDGEQQFKLRDESVVLRYKGAVPMFVLIPHIIFIFMAMMFSTRAGMEAIIKGKNLVSYSLWTVILFAFAGMFLGPVVQKYAFDAFWTGWPFGTDLTDNKTLAALVLWVVAYFQVRKSPNKWGWVLAASVLLFVVYLIPHSMFGSEIDYTKQ
jgi:hypothetical protein